MSILVGITKEGKRIHIDEYKDEKVFCAFGHELVAKKGEKRIHHYSHKTHTDCKYSKNVGDWHNWWQYRIDPKYLEVKMENHIADIKIGDFVIELQHSNMDKETMKEREKFYGNMCWIFDCTIMDFQEIKKNKNLICLKLVKGSSYFLKSKKDTYLDLGHRGLCYVLKKKGKLIWCKRMSLKRIDKDLFKNKMREGYDQRLNKPFYDLSVKCTKEEQKEFLKN